MEAKPQTTCHEQINLEKERIIKEIDQIEINTTSQINALGMKILIKEIINSNQDPKFPR
jgi:hypothetical protein